MVINKITEQVCEEEDPCAECNECSTHCDVCGVWYWKDEPCEFH